MTEESSGRVTTKEFYELQLQTNKVIQEIRRDVSVIIERQENTIKDAAEKFAAVDRRFDVQDKINDRRETEIETLKEEVQGHEKVDNWFKGISGIVQAAIVTVQLWWMNSQK